MRISLEWLSDYVTLPEGISPKQLAHDLTLKTVEVEDVIYHDQDVIFEIDNKSLTNRPDLWGHYGIAREFAAIYDLPLVPLPTAARPPLRRDLIGTVDPQVCHRFTVTMCEIDPSTVTPQWIGRRLRAIGENTVNLSVDLSNYVMFTVGQPIHVYDADRLSLPLAGSASTGGETADLLSAATFELPPGVPVIRDARSVAGLAGIMGGAATAVTPTASRLVVEAATFRPGPVRQASAKLGLRTDASARFEKNLDTQRVDAAIDLYLHLLTQVGGTATGWQDVTLQRTEPAHVSVDLEFLRRRIGEAVPVPKIEAILTALGFTTTVIGNRVEVVAPTWRSTGDIGLPHDIVEEIARMHGYDSLPTAPVMVTLQPVRGLRTRPLDRQVREQLATRAGLQEIITYPWTADHLLPATGNTTDQTVRTSDAPAPDRDSLRPSLVPNVLEAVAANLRHQDTVAIFEVGTVFGGGPLVAYHGYEPMPPQATHLAMAVTGSDGPALFRRAKGVLEMLHRRCHLTELILHGDTESGWADPTARLAIHAHGRQVGTLGLVTPRIRRLAGIGDTQVACVELDLDALGMRPSRDNRYQPVPDLPDGDFDLSVVVADTVPWAQVSHVAAAAHPLIASVTYVDEFRGSWVPAGHRSLSLRVTARPNSQTLTADDINAVRSIVLAVLARELDARPRQ